VFSVQLTHLLVVVIIIVVVVFVAVCRNLLLLFFFFRGGKGREMKIREKKKSFWISGMAKYFGLKIKKMTMMMTAVTAKCVYLQKNINTFSSFVYMDSVEFFILFSKLTSML